VSEFDVTEPYNINLNTPWLPISLQKPQPRHSGHYRSSSPPLSSLELDTVFALSYLEKVVAPESE
jgi:hypothetical protein